MSNDLEDFWKDIRLPPRPKPPVNPWLGTLPQRGFVWFALTLENDAFKGRIMPRIRAAIPEGNPMVFTFPVEPEKEMIIGGIEMYDRKHSGELLYASPLPHLYTLRPGDTLNLNLTLTDNMEERMQNLAGLRTGFRLRGLL